MEKATVLGPFVLKPSSVLVGAQLAARIRLDFGTRVHDGRVTAQDDVAALELLDALDPGLAVMDADFEALAMLENFFLPLWQ